MITVWTKLDVGPAEAACDAAVSAKTGAGLDELKQAILQATGLSDFQASAPRAFTERQSELLAAAAEAIDRADASRAGELLVELLEGSAEWRTQRASGWRPQGKRSGA